METELVAIVLAAGASGRLGRPKALLDFDGLSALEIAMRTLREVGVADGVVVTGDASDVIRRAVDPTPFVFVRNPLPSAGRTGSIVVGLAATDASTDVLLWPVDRPLASRETVLALLHARATDDADVIVPETGDRRGHPLLLSARLRAAILAADPDASLRDLLRASGARRSVVPVEDPGIHFNLDTDEDWKAAVAWWRTRSER